MSNGLFIGDKDPIEIRVGNRKATSVYYSGDNVPQNPVLHISAKGLTTAGIAQSGGVVDLSGNGNNGTAYGGLEVVNDPDLGECFSFDGTDDYIIENNFLTEDTSFSIAVNLKLDSNFKHDVGRIITLFSNRNGGYRGFSFYYYYQTNKIAAQFFNGTIGREFLSSATFECNKFYQISFVYDFQNNKLTLYCNNIKIIEESVSGGFKFHQVDSLFIGRDSANHQQDITGLISEVKIFPYALTSEQVQALYRGIKKVWSNVPEGAILHLNAKGLTTEGIAKSGGVTDLSGNGNNGTAYGGVEVVNDSEMGECFSYANSTSAQSIWGNFQNPSDSLTLSVRYKRTGSKSGYNQLLLEDASSSNVCRLAIYITTNTNVNLVSVAMYSNNDKDILSCNINTILGKVTTDEHVYTATYDASASLLSLYVDGILAATKTRTAQSFTVSKFIMGYPTAPYRPIGLINDIYIYPRALTAHEVKKLYMASRK